MSLFSENGWAGQAVLRWVPEGCPGRVYWYLTSIYACLIFGVGMITLGGAAEFHTQPPAYLVIPTYMVVGYHLNMPPLQHVPLVINMLTFFFTFVLQSVVTGILVVKGLKNSCGLDKILLYTIAIWTALCILCFAIGAMSKSRKFYRWSSFACVLILCIGLVLSTKVPILKSKLWSSTSMFKAAFAIVGKMIYLMMYSQYIIFEYETEQLSLREFYTWRHHVLAFYTGIITILYKLVKLIHGNCNDQS